MHKQLWFRLLLGSSFILIVALTTAGFILHRSTTSSFEEYVEDVSAARSQRIEALLSRYYSRRQDWSGVDPLVQQIADLVGQPVILANSTDEVIVDSQNQLTGQRVRDAWKHQVVPIRSGDVAVGTLYIDPLHVPNKLGARGDAFLAELSTSLLSALGVGLLAALAISLLVARRLAHPLETLTRAVRRLEAGERTAHIDASMGGEVGALAVAFNSAVDSLARVENLRANMVNDIAHELRTPLTTIRGYVEALQDGVAEPTPEVLDVVYGELLQLTRLVDDLRDLALAEAGQLHLAIQPHSVDALIAHDARAISVAADANQISVETRVDEEVPAIWVDAGRFSQALRNLLNNAVAHTPPGGRISISASVDDKFVSVAVQDSGAGIPADDLPHVFERFYRGDRSRSRRAGGAGLGLTIAREILSAHQGDLTVASPPGEGARFTLRVPVGPPPLPKPSSEAELAAGPARPGVLVRLLNVGRLAFYGFMCGGLAGMVGGAAESLMIAAVNRRSVEAVSVASYAVIIDALAIGILCATIAILAGIVGALRGQAPRFRDIATGVGPIGVIAVGSVLALKWAQLTARDASSTNAIGGQLLIIGGTLLLAAVTFAAISTAGRWPQRAVRLGQRLVPGLALIVGIIAVVGVLRDLSDRGLEGPTVLLRIVHDGTLGRFDLRDGALPVGPVSGASAVSAGNRPNILLITVDALRADHLGAYGYQTTQTPTLDALARQGWKVELAASPRAGSTASHASILTGTSPSRHGIRADLADTLAHDVPTLAEILQENGYTTAGLYSWFNFEPAYSGLDRGFQVYEDYTINLPRYLEDSQTQALAATYRRLKSYLAIPAATDLDVALSDTGEGNLDGKADVTATAATRWLERRRSDPFFLWVHFRDPHAPYTSPAAPDNSASCVTCQGGSAEVLQKIRNGATDLSAPEINSVVRAYDEEVAFVDRSVDQILRQLSQLGLDSNTLVIVAGAYGQSLGDHGLWLEGTSVFNSEIHVPLLLRHPGYLQPGRVVTQTSSLLDVMPTILHVAGIRTPQHLEGRSLISLAEEWSILDRSVFAESAQSDHVALISGEWKLIKYADGHVELYHIAADPDELLDRADTEPEVARHLLEQMDQRANEHLDAFRPR